MFQTSKHMCCVDSNFVVCIQQQMQGSVCFLYVNVVDPRPCLLNAKLIDRTITAIFFGTYKLGMSAEIPEIGYLFPVVC